MYCWDCRTSEATHPTVSHGQAMANAPDPLVREQFARGRVEAAREQWRQEAGKWAAIRAEAVMELKTGRTWAEVAELLGVSEPTAWNIAHPKEKRLGAADSGVEVGG
jgi:hypothetical protein